MSCTLHHIEKVALCLDGANRDVNPEVHVNLHENVAVNMILLLLNVFGCQNVVLRTDIPDVISAVLSEMTSEAV